MDSTGKLFNKANVHFRIVRSGKRNNIGTTVFSATSMDNPIKIHKPWLPISDSLVIYNTSKVVTASAMEYKEKWQTDHDVLKRYKTVPSGADTSTANIIVNGDFSQGNTGFYTDFSWNGYDCNFPCFKCYKICNSGAHGNTMSFNGFSQVAWQQTVAVFPNRDYTFSASFYNVNSAMATILITINDIPIAGTFSLQPVGWQTFSFSWNSGGAVNAVIKIMDTNGNENGNDFSLDDISMIKSNCGLPVVEIPDCDGSLEKNINPYVKGLVGNFKPHRSYTFYGERNENNPNTPTAIRRNGFLKDFSQYWFFDKEPGAVTKDLIPLPANAKWVWNSELTKTNSKGQELETKDALNRYTAAQYGFAKNMPVAMTQNARYGESFAEGFEDETYREHINIVYPDSCLNNKYITFAGLANGSIVEDPVVKAHSGKNVLRIAENSQVVKTLKIANAIIDQYDLITGTGTVPGAVGPYGTFSKLTSTPVSEPVPGILNIGYGGSLSMNYSIQSTAHHGNPYLEVNSSGVGNFRAFYKTTQYFKVVFPTTYTFNLSANHSGIGHHLQPNEPPPSFFRTAITLTIRKKTGEIVFTQTLYSDQGSGSWSGSNNSTGSVYLPCGEYTAESLPSSDITYQNPPPGNIPGTYALYNFNSWAGYSCNPALYAYSPVCTYSTPIPATDSMLNPVFNLVPGKKMQFSAWVKEDCSVPCSKTDYSLSKIEIWSGGVQIGAASLTNPVKRTGTIIEGWQKIEGEFIVPANATTAEIRFINSNTNASMYVDDIRIHPYNANMKSYVYDPRTLRLSGELDENNYASFYEYDEEGQLIRVKKETIQGIKTIQETRSAKQKVITDVQ